MAGVTQDNWLRPSNMTFHDFVVQLREVQKSSKFLVNAHFMPQTQLCRIDTFPYDYIAEVACC